MPAARVVWTPGTADLPRFAAGAHGTAIREEFKLGEAPVVVSVSRLAANRGHELLLNAFRRLLATMPEARLLLVGKGETRARLEQTVADMGLGGQVIFTGYRDAISPLFSRRDCFSLWPRLDDSVIRARGDGRRRPSCQAGGGALPRRSLTVRPGFFSSTRTVPGRGGGTGRGTAIVVAAGHGPRRTRARGEGVSDPIAAVTTSDRVYRRISYPPYRPCVKSSTSLLPRLVASRLVRAGDAGLTPRSMVTPVPIGNLAKVIEARERGRGAYVTFALRCVNLPPPTADVRRLVRWLADTDVVHVHRGKEHWLAAVANRLVRRPPPLVRTRHIAQAVRPHAANRWLYGRATALTLAVTGAIRGQYVASGLVDAERVVTLPGGADAETYRPDQPRSAPRAARRGRRRPLVGMFGGLRVMKVTVSWSRPPPVSPRAGFARTSRSWEGSQEAEVRGVIARHGLARSSRSPLRGRPAR